MKRKFKESKEKVICKQYVEDKLSILQLSKKYNCSGAAVRNVLIRNNISLRPVGCPKGKKFAKGVHVGKNNPMYGKHHSNETKQKIRKKAIERTKDPEYKEKMKEQNEMQKKVWADFEKRKNHSKKMEKVMANPEVREKMRVNTKKAMANPEVREKIRKNAIERCKDPVERKRLSEISSTPEAIQQSLKNGYGIKCYYKGEFFPSLFERDGFIRLIDLGFEFAHNFLGRFDAKARKDNFEAVVEFHQFGYKKNLDSKGRTEKQYYKERRKKLDERGYKNLQLVVIKDLKEIEIKLSNEKSK